MGHRGVSFVPFVYYFNLFCRILFCRILLRAYFSPLESDIHFKIEGTDSKMNAVYLMSNFLGNNSL